MRQHTVISSHRTADPMGKVCPQDHLGLCWAAWLKPDCLKKTSKKPILWGELSLQTRLRFSWEVPLKSDCPREPTKQLILQKELSPQAQLGRCQPEGREGRCQIFLASILLVSGSQQTGGRESVRVPSSLLFCWFPGATTSRKEGGKISDLPNLPFCWS